MSSRWRSMVGVGVVVLVVGGIGAGLWISETSTAQFTPHPEPGCHDAFRLVSPTASGVDSVINIVLMITLPEWPDLQAFFRNYAKQYGWSDRDLSKTVPGSYQRIYVDICSEHFNIGVNWILWDDHPTYTDFMEKQVPMDLYTNASQEQWHAVARGFVQALETKWPGRAKFRNGSGAFIEPPDYLHLH